MLDHYGAAGIKRAIIYDRKTYDEILGQLKTATAPYTRAWLLSYRAENKKNVQAVILRHPEMFRPVARESFYKSTSLLLLDLVRETTSTVTLAREE